MDIYLDNLDTCEYHYKRDQYKSKFQFINNISTSDIQLVDQNVLDHMLLAATKFLQDLNCRPLEGK